MVMATETAAPLSDVAVRNARHIARFAARPNVQPLPPAAVTRGFEAFAYPKLVGAKGHSRNVYCQQPGSMPLACRAAAAELGTSRVALHRQRVERKGGRAQRHMGPAASLAVATCAKLAMFWPQPRRCVGCGTLTSQSAARP